MAEKYLGFTVHDKDNVIALRYNKEEYKEIIRNAHALGMSPTHYCAMMMSPCGSCGNDKVVITKLTTMLNKNFKHASGVHLFCFINSKINTGLTETNLQLNYSMSYVLQISQDAKIYAPQNKSNNTSRDSNATITLFSDDVKTATFSCKIKNNQIYSLTENI